MSPETTRVGFVGLGSQGGPMARRIIDAGFPTTLWARRPESLEPFADTSAAVAASVRDLAAASDVLGVCVVDDAGVDEVLRGPDGALQAMSDGSVVIIHSTVHPTTCLRLQEDFPAIHVIDAPVSGGVVGAEAATIAIMVGGDKKVFDDALPLLQSFSANVIHMGELGTGTVAKLVNNMMAFCNAAAAAEGLMLGVTAGLDPQKLVQVIASSSGNSSVFKAFSERALSGQFSPPSFALNLAHKDLHLAMELADELDVPLPQGSATHNLQRMARRMGLGNNDSSAVLQVYESVLKKTVKP